MEVNKEESMPIDDPLVTLVGDLDSLAARTAELLAADDMGNNDARIRRIEKDLESVPAQPSVELCVSCQDRARAIKFGCGHGDLCEMCTLSDVQKCLASPDFDQCLVCPTCSDRVAMFC